MAKKSWKRWMLSGLTIRDELARALLSEFYATFIVSVFVHAAVAQDTVSRTMSSFNVSFTVGMGVVLAVYSGFGVSGGHINLALSVGVATLGIFPWRRVPLYYVAQVAGGFVGAGVVYLVYVDAFNEFDGGTRQAFGENGTAAIFATFPQPYLSLTTGFFEQVLNTGLLLATIGPVMDRRNSPPPLSLAPFFFGLIVFTILMSYGYNAGAPLNPSVDLSGRLLLTAVGYGKEVWMPGGVHWWWIPLVGPAVGAFLGALTYYFAIELHHPPLDDEDEQLDPSLDDDEKKPLDKLNHNDIELKCTSNHRRESVNTYAKLTTRKLDEFDDEIDNDSKDDVILGPFCDEMLAKDSFLNHVTARARKSC